MATFRILTDDLRCPPERVDRLSSITPLDLARSVPFLSIARLDPTTRAPVAGRSISYDLLSPAPITTPGASVAGRGRPDRPLVSLESVSVTSKQSHDTYTNSLVQMNFVVHDPEAVFSGDDDVSAWTSVLQPGALHLLEYGWTSTLDNTNPILNGDGFSVPNGRAVPGRRSLVFSSVRYELGVNTDGSVRFNVHAIESTDTALRRATLGESFDPTDHGATVHERSKKLDALGRLTAIVDSLPRYRRGGLTDAILFKDVADRVLAPVVESVALAMGYGSVDLAFGQFNETTGATSAPYGGVDMSSLSIGEFPIPVRKLKDLLGTLAANNRVVVVDVLMQLVVNLLRGNEPWATAPAGKQRLVPSLSIHALTTRPGGGKLVYHLWIIDDHAGRTPFADKAFAGPDKTRADVRRRVREAGVPFIQLGHGHSFVEEVALEVIQTDLLKAIAIERAVGKTRSDIVTASPEALAKAAVAPSRLIHMSTVQGTIRMIGNFVFENFQTVWLDVFGVRQTSGPFVITGKTDTIEPGRFTSTLDVISDGTDPLGTRRVD